MKLFTYTGQAPTISRTDHAEMILEVMLEQIQVMRLLVEGIVLIPAGTRIEPVDPGVDE